MSTPYRAVTSKNTEISALFLNAEDIQQPQATQSVSLESSPAKSAALSPANRSTELSHDLSNLNLDAESATHPSHVHLGLETINAGVTEEDEDDDNRRRFPAVLTRLPSNDSNVSTASPSNDISDDRYRMTKARSLSGNAATLLSALGRKQTTLGTPPLSSSPFLADCISPSPSATDLLQNRKLVERGSRLSLLHNKDATFSRNSSDAELNLRVLSRRSTDEDISHMSKAEVDGLQTYMVSGQRFDAPAFLKPFAFIAHGAYGMVCAAHQTSDSIHSIASSHVLNMGASEQAAGEVVAVKRIPCALTMLDRLSCALKEIKALR